MNTGELVLLLEGLPFRENEFLVLDDAVGSISGVWDLPMLGGEALDVEHRYQLETGGPAVTLSNLGGAFVERDNVVCQLQDDFDDSEYVAGSKIWGEHLEQRILEEIFERASRRVTSALQSVRQQLKEQWKRKPSSRYYPAAGLPADAVYVVRTASLRAFEQSVLDNPSSSNGKPLGRRKKASC